MERELEWKPYTSEKAMSDDEYDELVRSCEKPMGESYAIELVHREYGFAEEKIEVVYEKPIYEINRHKQLRQVGVAKREPYYFATDYNYVRFTVCGVEYELCNGNLIMWP